MTDPTLHTRDEWEVTQGKMHHRREDGRKVVLARGDRFHPTLKQVADGSLENKARKVRDGGRPSAHTVTRDIGLRTLLMTDRALEIALDPAEDGSEPPLDVEDFHGVEPAGADGEYLTGQVRQIADARRSGDAGEDT